MQGLSIGATDLVCVDCMIVCSLKLDCDLMR